MRIMISYRRDDTGGYAGRLYDRLVEHFGEDNVFMDIDAIRPGQDFVEVIEEAVSSADVQLVIIGRQWLSVKDSKGQRRLENPKDFVRVEVGTALARDIQVIPVLVKEAHIPKIEQLPEELASLTRRQALEISDSRFHQDVDRLIEAIELGLAEQTREEGPETIRRDRREPEGRRVLPWILGGFAALVALVLGLWAIVNALGWLDGGSEPAPETPPPVEAVRILSFTVEPGRFTEGEVSTVQLTWETEGADSVSISGIGEVDPTGSINQPAPESDFTYTLVAENAAGESSAEARVEVIAAVEPEPITETAPPVEPPRVLSFTVEPGRFIEGHVSTVRLAWETEGAASVSISGVGEVDLVGFVNQPAPDNDLAFTLVAANTAGETSATARVEVLGIEEFLLVESSGAVSDALRRRIENWISSYLLYFGEIDYVPEMGRVIVFIDPDLTNNAFFDGERLVIGEPLAADPDVVLREYTHLLLKAAVEDTLGVVPFSGPMGGIESGLADYFPGSSLDDPRIAEVIAPDLVGRPFIRTLLNNRDFTELTPSSPPQDAGEIWGGAFWDIRLLMGKIPADRLILSTWLALQPADLSGDPAGNFVRRLLEVERTLEGGAFADEIRSIFQNRELDF